MMTQHDEVELITLTKKIEAIGPKLILTVKYTKRAEIEYKYSNFNNCLSLRRHKM